jgi:hypothetical protein
MTESVFVFNEKEYNLVRESFGELSIDILPFFEIVHDTEYELPPIKIYCKHSTSKGERYRAIQAHFHFKVLDNSLYNPLTAVNTNDIEDVLMHASVADEKMLKQYDEVRALVDAEEAKALLTGLKEFSFID